MSTSNKIVQYKPVRNVGKKTVLTCRGGDVDTVFMSSGEMFLEDHDNWTQLYFHCPCGCGEPLIVEVESVTCPHPPMEPNRCWKFILESDGTASLSPSLWFHGCPNDSHFFIRAGKVIWC